VRLDEAPVPVVILILILIFILILAFFLALGNNLVTGMRLFYLFAIVLSFSGLVAAFPRQDAPDSAKTAGNSSTQSTPSQSAPAETAPAQSPTESTPPVTVPAENPPTSQTTPDTTTAPKQKPAEGVEKKQAAARRKRPRKTTTHSGTPKKVVVRQGGAREPAEQIAPGVTPAEAVRQRQIAEQWLNSTDGQLKELSERSLNPQQQETIAQIRNYMNGARGALREGDVRRASTLAEKAHLLSDDLVKH
jgi:hypothetical protein